LRKLSYVSIPLFAATLALTSCNSSAPAPAATPATPKASEFLAGREVFQKLYVTAHAVAGDVRPYHMESRFTKGSPAMEGKSGIWRADFASPSKKLSKSFTWSGIVAPGAAEPGVSHGADDTYSPSNTTTQIFDPQYLKIDSDAAFKVAQQHGGEKLTRANSAQPIFYSLDFDARKSQLVWRITYGESQYDAKLNVSVDATTGVFLRSEP
jgi:hypothetical protein